MRRPVLAVLTAILTLLLAAVSTSASWASGVAIPGRYVGDVSFEVGGTTYAPLSTTPDRGQTYGYYQDRRVSSGFGAPRYPGHPHSGTDFAVREGTPVYAPFGGTVVTVSYDQVFGNYVLLRSSRGRVALFGHLSGTSVSGGDTVRAGSPLGRSGNTGSSTGPHLHLTMWRPDGKLTNALAWLKRNSVPLFFR